MSTPDPFAKYGGKAVTPGAEPDVTVHLDFGNGGGEDPFAKYGGKAVAPEPQAHEFVKAWWENANPFGLLKSIYGKGVVGTIKDVGAAQGEQFTKAKEAYGKGDYSEALRYTMGWLVPLLGPAANAAGDELGRGEYAKGAGHTLGIATGILAPEAISRVPSLRVAPGVTSRLNPAETAAVAFADREGIPLDAATRSGNRAVRGAQELVGKAIGGQSVALDAREAQASALTSTSERLKNRVEPNLGPSAYTPETAGQTVLDSITQRSRRFGRKAGEAYDVLRQAEQNPANATTVISSSGQARQIPLATDMRGVKTAIAPIYDEMKARLPIAQQQANPGLKALENILNGEDFVPASVAEGNLGAIKSIVRDARSPQASRLATQAINALDGEIMATVNQAGPDVARALERGRALTRAKYEAADVIENFGKRAEEPVKVFNAITADQDVAVNTLRKVGRQAPQDLPKIGRAYLEGLFNMAKEEGGFGRSARLFSEWKRLGPQTKAALFKNPALVQDLDNFFLLAKRMADNPNPSGTASVVQLAGLGGEIGGSMGLLLHDPKAAAAGLAGAGTYVLGANVLARLFFTPKGSQALLKGLRVPLGNPVAATLAANEILALAGKENVSPLEANRGGRSAIPALVPAQ
jgi:hypothetical protein